MKKSILKCQYIIFAAACVLCLSSVNAFALPSVPPTALQPATALDFTSGVGFGSGSVSNGHAIFSFAGTAGESASITLNVTSYDQATPIGTDEAGIFLFGVQGEYLGHVYDTHQSGHFNPTLDFLLADSGTYYVGVVTIFNHPNMDGNRIISSWNDTGRNNVEFELTANVGANPVPEPATMLLFGAGLVGFGGMRLKKKLV